ncbi:DNAJ heat shock N-terminal domain-containing protein [Actinidia rufa]|uniref:DNAJ heat shock N-terminal domain-containing protein n=1 Tax=Actinidia rufa TaxID=165716 RepID=A0A7J0FXU3_9ERIC|nr:DNAJ heat shock N-terminal domain-containing protein [Actinidia rufa]
MASPEPEKRCHYEVLGLQRDCSADEIRSAYKKLALQRHPDKLAASGVSPAAATAAFQELVNAYEVLSDPRERSWYDSHRSQILFSGSTPSNSSNSIPNLFPFFSNSVFSGYSDAGKGFYKVYGELFNKIYSNELNFAKKLGLGLGAVREAPVMGNLESPYSQVTAFYGYWLGFVTVMDFYWVDQYDAMAGPNRKSRRVMEEENKKVRKKARREYNDTVRGLAEFVKKRDKRVIDMQLRRSEEMERKREEERERKREMEREKMERVRAYKEVEWAAVEEEGGEIEEDNEIEEEKRKELYCVACGKKFKSEKQWKNHEQSKKHKEKVAELREAFGNEENENGEREEEEEGKEDELGNNGDGSGFAAADDGMEELSEQFGGRFQIPKESSDHDEAQSSEEEGSVDIDDDDGPKGADDDEASICEAMVSGHKSRKNVNSVHQPKAKASSAKNRGGSDNDEMDSMVYNNMKSARRKQRARRYDEEDTTVDATETSGQVGKDNGLDNGLHEDEASSRVFVENETNGKGDDKKEKKGKVQKQAVDKKGTGNKDENGKSKKGTGNKDENAKSKNSSKGRKQKVSTCLLLMLSLLYCAIGVLFVIVI